MVKSPRSPRSPLSPKLQRIPDEALCLQMQQFLDQWHFKVMKSSLGKNMNRLKVVEAALQVLAMNGIPLSQEEIALLVPMEEQLMIFEVVAKIPEGLRDSFEHLLLELQLVVNAATRLRGTIESGDEPAIQALMEESSSTSLGQHTLKRTIVQASTEVAKIMRCKETWGPSMAARLDRLSNSQGIAEATQKTLLAVEAQLEAQAPKMIENAKQALVGFANATATGLAQLVLVNWRGVTVRDKSERELRKRFEREVEDAEQALTEFKGAQLKNIRSVMMHAANREEEDLMSSIIGSWRQLVDHVKAESWNHAQVDKIQMVLSKQTKDKCENAKKVMGRMMLGQQEGQMATCFAAWVHFIEDYRKDKDFEDAVKRSEQKMEEYMKKKQEDAKAVLERVMAGTDSGLLKLGMTAWIQYAIDGKKLRQLEEQVNGHGGKFKSLQLKQKGVGTGVQGRVNEQMNLNLQYRCLMAWLADTKVARIEKYYTAKIESKRKQLSSVQMLFHSFAQDLETGLKDVDGDSSGRGGSHRRGGRPKGMAKSEPVHALAASVSLPDFHKQKQHDR